MSSFFCKSPKILCVQESGRPADHTESKNTALVDQTDAVFFETKKKREEKMKNRLLCDYMIANDF